MKIATEISVYLFSLNPALLINISNLFHAIAEQSEWSSFGLFFVLNKSNHLFSTLALALYYD